MLERFWSRRGGTYSLGDGGYLVGSDLDLAWLLDAQAIPTAKVLDKHCVALLGEPGIGKSTAMHQAIAALQLTTDSVGELVNVIDLREFGSEDRLERRLSKALSPLKDTQRLHVFLDSLDECTIEIPNVAAMLIGILNELPPADISRLRLRIACRTAEWPTQFDEHLPRLFGADHFNAFELLPLRRVDIEAAAAEAGVSAPQFLDAVGRADAQPLAIKPITLRFLLDAFKSGGALPRSQVELYSGGCRLLCGELSPSRVDAGHTGDLTAEQRFVVASRIAAILMFSRHTAVSQDPATVGSRGSVLGVASFTGGVESTGGNQFAVEERAVMETLRTGLFSGRGPQLIGFSHQTYAEFMAAHYLREHHLGIAQISSLIYHGGSDERRVVPQLAEVTAWLASMDKAVFRNVMESEPQLLLRSDAGTADSDEREAVLAALFAGLDAGTIIDPPWPIRQRFDRFAHPRLDTQLRTILTDRTRDPLARRVAIDVAEQAKVQTLQDVLCGIACDAAENYYLRSRAAGAVVEVGGKEAQSRLSPLLDLAPPDDPNDELRGYALEGLWSHRLIGLPELLRALRPPQRKSCSGSYDAFLRDGVARHLQAAEVPAVLDWLREHYTSIDERIDSTVGQQRLSDTVVLAAWQHLEDVDICNSLADYALLRLSNHDRILSGLATPAEHEILKADTARRRRLARALVDRIENFGVNGFYLVHARFSLVYQQDLPWLLDNAINTEAPDIARRFSQLAAWVFDRRSVSDIDQIVIAASKSPIVAETFAPLLNPVALESPEAAAIRKAYEEWERPAATRRRPAHAVPTMPAEVKRLVGVCESGKAEAWVRLNYAMMFDSTGQPADKNDLEDDLRTLPGWTDADQETRQRIVHAAVIYLNEGSPNDHEWLGTDTIHRPAFAGYRALALLIQEDPATLASLSPEVWERWAAITLAFPVSIGVVGEDEPALSLIGLAYSKAPNALISALLVLIDHESADRQGDELFILRKLARCWDEGMCSALLSKARDPKVKPAFVGSILAQLLEHGCNAARSYAESLLTAADSSQRDLRRGVMLALILSSADSGWNVVWPTILADPALGREVLEIVGDRDHGSGLIASRMTEDQVADLFLWLEREYPRDQDPKTDGAHFVSSRESVAHFRDFLLRSLQARSTPAAVAALRRIQSQLPQYDWLRTFVIGAKENMLRKTWVAPSPKEVLTLCTRPGSVLVRTADELQDVLIEALSEINAELQSETPESPALWNLPTGPHDPTLIRPKNETWISDWLKLRLEQKLGRRGIIALREVEIRRGEGRAGSKAPGERTDLHVTGVTASQADGEFESVRVIIEVKGCWHNEIGTAMQSQLADRYLRDNECRHGIYIVFWFMCSQWDDSDSRKAGTPNWTLAEASSNLGNQAENLSRDDLRIRSYVMNAALR